jgi:DNA phosphorothioation-dependent restriction protein DptH
VRSHVKMLQDPGIKVQISKTNADPTANLPEIPYRRFLGVPASTSNAGETIMVPRLSLEAVTWQEFSSALSALESFAYGDQISASLQLSAIVGGDSDWTVSGEGMIGPAAIMSLLSSSNARDSMLWEWRPPFLNTNSLSQELSRRPYFAIAKIPSSFKSQISNKVRKALPADDEAPDEIATKALKVLGGRGMGLSGLMSMGSTHTTGALGFFAAFDLLDQLSLPEGEGLLVLPVDACEPFIETLSGQKSTQLNKRADLLAIVFSEDSATLIPIEVKLIGLDAQSSVQPTLPSPDSKALDEAKGQVANTSKFLLEVVDQSQKHLSGNANIESALWRTNFATLLDAGSKLTKLSKSNSLTLSKLIGRVLNGVATLEVGGSVITYFHAASTNGAGGSWTSSCLEPEGNERASFVLVCSIGTALSQNEDKSALYTDWNLLFESAISSFTDSEVEGEGQPTPRSNVAKSDSIELEDQSEESKPDDDTDDENRDADEESKPENGKDEEAHDSEELIPEDVVDDDKAISPKIGDGYFSAIGKGQQGQTISWRPSSLEQGLMLGVIGKPGMGKTQLLLSVMQDLSELKNSDGTSTALFVFDFKGEFSAMDDFNQLYGFSVVNVLESVPFDIWALPEESKNDLKLGQRVIQICDTFQSIYNIGPTQKFRLSEVLVDQYKKRQFGSPSLSDIADGYAKARGAAAPDTIDSILNQFKLTGAFLPDSSMPQVASMQDYLRSGRKIFNFQLDQIASPQIIRFFATVILNEYNQLMMSQPNETNFPDGLRRLRSILIVDEAQNLMQHRPVSLSKVQSMGRSKGYGLVLASQQLSHFRPDSGVNFANLMDTWAFFSSAGLTRADLNGVGASPDTSQKLLSAINQLGQGQAAFLSPTDKHGDWGSAEQYWRRKAQLD